jgi:molybdopterin-guanine dinucleotide biosynthesis protein A
VQQAGSKPVDPGDHDAELRYLGHCDSGWAAEWAGLIGQAEGEMAAHRLERARLLHEQAWQASYDRCTQGATMHHIGRRWLRYNDRHAAAGSFELARALRRGFVDPVLTSNSEQGLAWTRHALGLDAIVLTGGAGRRVEYRDKAELHLAGWPMADHVLLAVSGAARRIVVGPERRGLSEPEFCREDPPGAGPVAAIAAALERVTQAEVAILAADEPFIGPGLDVLRTALMVQGNDFGAYVDTGGRINYLAAVWRTAALRRAVAALANPAGAAVRALYDGVNGAFIPDFDALAADCDTYGDLREAESRIRQIEGRPPGRCPALLPRSPLAWPGLELHAPS